jgi:hypothetical protein
MATILEMYDFYIQEELSLLSKALDAVTRAGRHPSEIKRRQDLLSRKFDQYVAKRKVFKKLLETKHIPAILELFKEDTGNNYVPIVVRIPPARFHSPQRTVRNRMKKTVLNRGGPVHPSFLSNYPAKKNIPEYRRTARLSPGLKRSMKI